MQNGRFCHRCGWDSKVPGGAGASARGAEVYYGRARWKRLTMSVTTWITLAIVLAFLLVPQQGNTGAIVPGVPAPDFRLSSLDGQPTSLADLRGKAVVLNFWASWCPPCRSEMPHLQAVAEKYRDQGLVVLAVNLDESPAVIRSFLDRQQIKLNVLLDPGQHTAEKYKILPLPTTFFVGRDGVVRSRVEGEMDLNRAEAEVLRLLNQK